MSDSAFFIVLFAVIGGALRVSTPFMFVALGECLTEKSGRVNLGLEGTLVLGAMCAYAISFHTGSPWLGVFAAGCAGSALGANWVEENFYLSGPRYDGVLPPCDAQAALGKIVSRFGDKEHAFWNSALKIAGFDISKRDAISPITLSVSRRCESCSPGYPKIRFNVTRIPARRHFRAASAISGMC